jgi:hypothetical protein
MTPRIPASPTKLDTPDLDLAITDAESRAIVVWRGEQIAFAAVPDRIARIDDRDARDRLYRAYLEAVEALNPLYEARLAAWQQAGDVAELAATGRDPRALASDLERFVVHGETPYYAALRRYLALVDIEQGDATEADLWHVVRGAAWSAWFGDRDVRRAAGAAGRTAIGLDREDGWLAAEAALGGEPPGRDQVVARAVSAAYTTLAGSPAWLAEELGVAADSVPQLVDFTSFARLWRLRRAIGELQFELRLYEVTDPGLMRAYHAGLVGHMTGVEVPGASYLRAIDRPFASAREIEVAILGACLVEVLEQRHGTSWWRDPASAELVADVERTATTDDALAHLGYDALDWRPLLRQIRTRLIGEMSGYGGPNITTRAGTRKV